MAETTGCHAYYEVKFLSERAPWSRAGNACVFQLRPIPAQGEWRLLPPICPKKLWILQGEARASPLRQNIKRAQQPPSTPRLIEAMLDA